MWDTPGLAFRFVAFNFVDDLHKEVQPMDLIIFLNNTNLFYSDSNNKILFETVNSELQLINDWLRAN